MQNAPSHACPPQRCSDDISRHIALEPLQTLATQLAQAPAAAGTHGAPAAAAGASSNPHVSAAPTTVLRLANMATREELSDPTEYEDIISDIAGAPALPHPLPALPRFSTGGPDHPRC